ncbi:MAG: glycosyltransferase [Verrucomicrobiota bacterium]
MARIAYIFTTFPKLSEQFFMREVLELQKQGIEMDIYSLIDGDKISEAGPVTEMDARAWWLLILDLLYWLLRRPVVSACLMRKVVFKRYGSRINYGENLLGLAFAFKFARHFERCGYAYAHATWATAPGMAAYALEALIDLPFTLEAHAYDVFRDGGDAFLLPKLESAKRVRSSTEATAGELRRQLGDTADKVSCVRRGLSEIPTYRQRFELDGPLQILSVGRLIEKKGYFQQLAIYAALKQLGCPFVATIVGEGSLELALSEQLRKLGLESCVRLAGKLDYPEVEALYLKADLFLFTGVVSESGDRDGFPNVIGEAMSYSLPVFSTDVSGTTEGIHDQDTGYVIDLDDIEAVAQKIRASMKDREALERVTRKAHAWILDSFEVSANMNELGVQLWDL